MSISSVHEAHLLMQYISDAVGSIRDPDELFRTVTDKLRLVFEFDSVVIITFDKERRYSNVIFEMLRFQLPEGIERTKEKACFWLLDRTAHGGYVGFCFQY